MAKIRSGALNVYRKNSTEQQFKDVIKAMRDADVLSLSEVHGSALLKRLEKAGYTVVKSKGDTAIVAQGNFEVVENGSRTINDTEGPTGGMRSREAAFALLRDKSSGEEFWQVAAHTTPPRQGPKGLRQKIRKEQYGSLGDLQRELGKRAPVILGGDLNFKQPKIKGMDAATQGGIMHTFSDDQLRSGKTDRVGDLNSDHNAVVTTFDTRKGPDRVTKAGGGKGKSKGEPEFDKIKGLNARQLEREYGFGYQFFRSDPELWDLLKSAIEKGWGPNRFRAGLKDTKWYRNHSDVWRQNAALKATDPTTYRERLNNYRDQIENLSGQWGVELDQDEVGRYATRAMMMGWSADQILDHIAKDVRPGKDGGYQGQLAGIQERLKNTAFRNGVRVDNKTMTGWMKAIVAGNADVAQYEDYVRRMAAESFQAFGQDIRAGVDLADVAAPYMNSMAELLELNPNEVNLFDRTIRKALSYRNEKGEARPMSLTDFEDSLRADKRWQYTDQAKEQLQGYAVALGKSWGVIS